jgi:hypothetical protein
MQPFMTHDKHGLMTLSIMTLNIMSLGITINKMQHST